MVKKPLDYNEVNFFNLTVQAKVWHKLKEWDLQQFYNDSSFVL